MIVIDTAALANVAGTSAMGMWQLVSSGIIPLSTWFVAAYALLYHTKANPHKDWVARAKVTTAGLLLIVATIADIVRWAAA